MLKRFLAIVALAAAAAACNSGATLMPTLSLQSPGGLASAPASAMPIESMAPSP
ncbi:MAG TPA: hypothetical protein VGI98_01295 [Candidatus Limnocylindrales bacterium]